MRIHWNVDGGAAEGPHRYAAERGLTNLGEGVDEGFQTAGLNGRSHGSSNGRLSTIVNVLGTRAPILPRPTGLDRCAAFISPPAVRIVVDFGCEVRPSAEAR
jgi:hypothetical protein